MKKIVLLSPAYPLRGGIAASSERLAQAFLEADWDTQIISYKVQYPSLLFPGRTQYATDSPAPVDLHIDSMIHSYSPYNWWRVAKYINRLQPDIVLARYWMPFFAPALGTIFRKVKNARRILLADNIIPHEEGMMDKFLTNYLMRQVDAAVVMSRSVGEDVQQFRADIPVNFAPHPVYDNYGSIMDRNMACAKLALDSSKRYILFFGFIRAYKGLDILIDAFAKIADQIPDVQLLVAGEAYGSPQPYYDQVQQLGLTDRFIWHEQYIPDQEVKYYFSVANLVAQTYRTATQSGISQLAAHFGKAILVTDVGGLSEILEHGQSGIITPIDVEDIAAALLDFFQLNLQTKLEQGIEAKREEFSWQNLVEAVIGTGTSVH